MATLSLVDGLGKTLAKVGEDEALVDNQHDKTIDSKPHKLVTSAKTAETGYVATEEIAQRDVTSVQIPASFAGLESVCIPVRMKNQLFEIEEVNEQDDYVEITAKHIFYQQRRNYTLWNPVLGMDYTGAAACRNIMANAIMDMGFEVASDCGDEVRNGDVMDYARKNIVEAFLDPETGVCAMYNLSLVRDNDVFYCLKEVGYDRGIVIQDKKNMLGVQRIENIEETVTRVVPYGKDEDGEIVWMNHDGKKWLDSTHINDYSKPKVGLLDTRLQIGSDGVTAENIQEKLLEKAQKAYSDDHIDAPDVSMTIQFISLGDTEEYAQYRGLDKVYLYDILHVKDLERGYSYSAEVVGVEHDILTGRLNSVTIGKLVDWDGIRKVMTWQIPEINGDSIRLHTIKEGAFRAGAVRSNDIANNAVNGNHFSNNANSTIKNLCVEQLIVENTSPDGLLNTRFQVTEGLIQSEITDRRNADDQMSSRITQTANAITAEVTRASAAEGELAGRLTVTAEAITAEVTRASEAEGTLRGALTVQADRITAEVTRATNAEGDLSGRLTVEADKITAEVARATAAEGTLSGRITVEAGKISQIVSAVGKDGQVTAASIVLAINQSTGESEAKIDAQHVYIGNDKSTTVINGKLNASDVTANYIKGKIGDIAQVVMNGASVVGDLYIRNGSGQQQNASAAIWDIQLTQSGNTYTLKRKRIQDADYVEIGTFSRATSLSGAWSGGVLTVSASPQGNTFKADLFTAGHWGYASSESKTTYYGSISAKHNGGSTSYSTGESFEVDASQIYTNGYNSGYNNGKPSGTITIGTKITGTTYNVSISRNDGTALGTTKDFSAIYTDARAGYYTQSQYDAHYRDGYIDGWAGYYNDSANWYSDYDVGGGNHEVWIPQKTKTWNGSSWNDSGSEKWFTYSSGGTNPYPTTKTFRCTGKTFSQGNWVYTFQYTISNSDLWTVGNSYKFHHNSNYS